MSLDKEQVTKFLSFFGGEATATLEKADTRRSAKQLAIEVLMSKLDKKTIRAGFVNLEILDSNGKKAPAFSDKGQEHEIDTFDAIKGGEGIRKEDREGTQKAMDLFAAYKKEALALKYPDGELIFDLKKRPQEFIDDCITPLVRERIIPDNFIQDALSDTYQLIKNALVSNKAEMKRLQEEKLAKYAKVQTNFMGGRGKLDRAAAIGDKIDQIKGRMVDTVGKKHVRNLGIAGGVAGVLKDAAPVVLDVKKWIPVDGKIPNVENAKLFLDPGSVLKMEDKAGVKKFGEEGWKHIKDNLKLTGDGDDQRVIIEEAKQMKMANSIKDILSSAGMGDTNDKDSFASKVGEFLAKPTNPILRDGKFYTEQGIEILKENITNGIDLGSKGYDIHKLDAALKKANHDEVSRRVAVETIEAVDDAFSKAIGKLNADAGDAVSDLYSKYVNGDDVEDATAPSTDGVKIVDLFAKGFSGAFADASPRLIPLGRAIEESFKGILNATPLKGEIGTNTETLKVAFADFKDAAVKAVEKNAVALSDAFKDKSLIGAIALKDIYPGEDGEEKLKQELDESDEEIKQFEKELVLIDQGGLSIAQQRSIEVLIEKMQKDRQVLSIVNTVGSSIQGLGSAPMSIVGYAVDGVSDVVVGEVLGPLKAAKLIMKFATDVKKACERQALYNKFKADLKNSKIAVSSLTSTIQGFYNNKKEQMAFRDIEMALTLIQIAAEIVGSVPTPMTIAVGKTMSKVVTAAQSTANFIESTYDTVMLDKAWKKTVEAIRNPGNRKVGLEALRLNPTLGMHAVAWAGMVKQPPDPVARMFMNSTGLDENTLAVSGTEEKVRTYLQTLLNEDRQLNDLDAVGYDLNELKVAWAPPLSLDFKCWALLTTRASRDASPPLMSGGEEKLILALFKPIGGQKKPEEYVNETDGTKLDKPIEELTALCKALRKYNPRHLQGDHDDMANEVAGLIALANKRLSELLRIRGAINEIRTVRDNITSVLKDGLLANSVKDLKKLTPTELAELVLSETEFDKTPVARAIKYLDQYSALKDDPAIKDLYAETKKLCEEFGDLAGSEFEKEVRISCERVAKLGPYCQSRETFLTLKDDEGTLKELEINSDGVVGYCDHWKNLESEIEKLEAETVKTGLQKKAVVVTNIRILQETIVESTLQSVLQPA